MKIVQLHTHEGKLLALCEDGKIYFLDSKTGDYFPGSHKFETTFFWSSFNVEVENHEDSYTEMRR